jgi:hypothetical protein
MLFEELVVRAVKGAVAIPMFCSINKDVERCGILTI